jgi:hypothetical protein
MHTADKNTVLETFFSSMSAYLRVVRSLSSRFSDELWNPFSKLETRIPQRFSSAATAPRENQINSGSTDRFGCSRSNKNKKKLKTSKQNGAEF